MYEDWKKDRGKKEKMKTIDQQVKDWQSLKAIAKALQIATGEYKEKLSSQLYAQCKAYTEKYPTKFTIVAKR